MYFLILARIEEWIFGWEESEYPVQYFDHVDYRFW